MNTASKPISEDQLYLSPRQAAELAGVALRTVWVWVRRKYNPLPASKVGGRRLIKKYILESWIDQQVPQPAIEGHDLKNLVDNIFAELKIRH